MHHYILQIFREPHTEKDWVTEDAFVNHPGLMPIANYVKRVYDRDYNIHCFGRWLAEHCVGILSGSSFTLAPDARSRYFDGRYTAFQKSLDALGTVTEPLYINDPDFVENLLSDLALSFCNQYSNYIMEANEPPVPFDQFIRTALPGVPYYIGGIMDYHY